MLERRADGRGAPPGPKPYSAAGGSAPVAAAVLRRVRVEMWPEGGMAVGGAESPCGEGADAGGSVIAAELTPCEVPNGEEPCWATLVAAAEASAEPVPSSEGTAKTKAKAVSAAGNDSPRPERQPSVVTATATRATNLPEGGERSPILTRGLCAQKSRKSEEAKGSPKPAPVSSHSSQHRGSDRKGCEAQRLG